MEHGFKFELNDVIYKNCFIESSRYQNGNLQLSLFGIDPKINANAHILDITLENNEVILPKDQIIVDCFYRPTLIAQLKELGIIQQQTGICVIGLKFYPIYTINFTEVAEKQYWMHELLVA